MVSRPLRVQEPGLWHHVMNRGLERRTIFAGEGDAFAFFELVAEAGSRWNLRCHAACLMSNHYHLLVQDVDGQLSRAMRHIDGVFTQQFNRTHNRDGPLMRGRYRSQLVDCEDYLVEVIRYIHLNPVKARIVDQASQYPWSSHRWYLARHAPEWLRREAVFERFGAGPGGKAAFDGFVHERVPEAVRATLEADDWKPVIGSRAFIDHWKERVRGKAVDREREIPEARHLVAPTVDAMVNSACVALGVAEPDLLRCGSGFRNPNRDLALMACRSRTCATNAELATRFRISPATVSTAVRRTQALLVMNSEVHLRYEMLLESLDAKSKAAT
jgi:putative transposase